MGSLWPGLDSTPVDDVDAPGTDALDGGDDVVGREPSGEDERHVVGDDVDQRPVEDLA